VPGHLVDAGRELERAAADVQDEQPAAGPAEPSPNCQERQLRLVLPGEQLKLDTGLRQHPRQDRLPVRRLPNCTGGKRKQVLDPLVLGDREALAGERHERLFARGGDRAVRLDVLGEPQLDLVRRGRKRMRADVGVDHQEVDRVGSHVDHAKSHVVNLPRRVPAHEKAAAA